MLCFFRFNVDNKPIRTFQKSQGVNFAAKPMHAEASIYNADWAGVVQWSEAPFTAQYEGFNINSNSASQQCNYFADSSLKTMQNLVPLNSTQQKQYEDIRRKYLRCSNVSNNYPKCPTKERIAK
ncbi:xyloglucan:xyloglucosyl transferase [Sarracenia purpurea var. burkii]